MGNHNAVAVNTMTRSTTSRVGMSASFGSAWLSLPTLPASFWQGAHTVVCCLLNHLSSSQAFWVRMSSVNNANFNVFFGHGAASARNGLHYMERTLHASMVGHLIVYWAHFQGFFGSDLQFFRTFRANRWYHIAFTFVSIYGQCCSVFQCIRDGL
jgi:hypothetical protein